MTREEMIEMLRYKAEHIKTKIKPEFFAEVADMLEKEPCEDAISRADAVRVASGYCHPANIAKELAKLPPVTPKAECSCDQIKWERDMAIAQLKELGYGLGEKPRTGHWIEIAQYSDGKHKIECSECKGLIFSRGHANSFVVKNEYKFCPHCGKRMIEPQESEKINCETTKCENCQNHNYCDFELHKSEE